MVRGDCEPAASWDSSQRSLRSVPASRRCRTAVTAVIDLRDVSDVDSAGLAVLIEWLAQARARGTRLEFTNLPPALRSLAKLSGVEFLFPELPAESLQEPRCQPSCRPDRQAGRQADQSADP